jgi:hypothetical protein
MKLGISSEDLQDLIVTRLSFDEEYEQQSRHGECKSKTGDETPTRITFGEKTSLAPCIFSLHCFHPGFPFPSTPSLGFRVCAWQITHHWAF